MTDTTIAKAILEQLGGRVFLAMTGAKNLIAGENYLSFLLPGGGGFTRHGINYVKVTLESSDTYTVAFSRIRGSKVATVAEHEDVYWDGLRKLVSDETGLALQMPRLMEVNHAG